MLLLWTAKVVGRRVTKAFACRERRLLSHFVTTPIFYVNSEPHIGHLYSCLLADAYHRYQLLKIDSGGEYFIFSSGTDEHGMKIEKAARDRKMSPGEHCVQVSSSFRRLVSEFGVSCTDFVRTTESRHVEAVTRFWNTLSANGHIQKRLYEGWYSVPDETFVPASQVKEIEVPGRGKVKVSAETGHPVEWSSEINYAFPLEQFRGDLIHWIRSERPIIPHKFGQIVLQWLEEECPSVSLSRPKSRLSWGIPVPKDPEQVIYVWLDALVNYLTVAGYPNSGFQWPPSLQVIGKDILKFHAVFWPAFLMASGLSLPTRILCHSHWTVDDVKMSKSKGNVVDPFVTADKFGHNVLRYFLLREGVAHSDGNYNEVKMLRIANAELADTLGNLLSRCSSTAVNPGQIWPELTKTLRNIETDVMTELMNSVERLSDKVEESFEALNFYRGLEHIMSTLRLTNVFVDQQKPWTLAKSLKDPTATSDHASLFVTTCLVMEVLRVCSILMSPVLPSISNHIQDRLSVNPGERKWKDLRPFVWEQGSGHKQRSLGHESSVLFKRIKIESKVST